MRDVPGFNFAMLAPALSVKGTEAVADFAKWCNHFIETMEVDDLIPDVVGSTEDDDSEDEDDEAEDSVEDSEGDVQDRKALEKSKVPTRYLSAVQAKDLEAFCLGIGVHPPALGKSEVDKNRSLELEQLMLNQTVEHVWLYARDGSADAWNEGKDLLVTHSDLLRFLVQYSTNQVRATGTQPWIGDVLSGDAEPYSIVAPREAKPVSASTLKKIASSISRFEALQYAVRGQPITDPVAKHVSIRAFLKRAKVAGPDESRKRLLDRHRRVNLAGFELNKKIKESDVYLSGGSSADIRDRAAMCCTTFSISRFTEATRWEIADTFRFVYPVETVEHLSQPMEVVYVIQGESKTRCDEDAEDWNCLKRNRFVEQCPLGSLALWFFWRFHVNKERFPDIAGAKSSWYPVKVFPHQQDPTSVVGACANRQRKRRALDKTGTRGRAILHDDRHFGSWWARLHEVPSTELDLLGFWRMDTRTQVYTKMHVPSIIVKVSGFSDVRDFFLPRAVLSPYDCQDEDIRSFANAVFAHVDDEAFKTAIQKKCQGRPEENDYAALHVADVFRLMRKVFLQDLFYYKRSWPDLEFWNADIMREHAAGVQKWLDIQAEVVAELEGLFSKFGGPPRLLTSDSRRSGSIVCAVGAAPEGFVKKPLAGSTHLAILHKATAAESSAMQNDDGSLGALVDATLVDNLADASDSLRGVWGVLEQHTTQLAMLRGEVKDNHHAVTRVLQAPVATPIDATTHQAARRQGQTSQDRSIDAAQELQFDFAHEPIEGQTVPATERDFLVDKLPPLSSDALQCYITLLQPFHPGYTLETLVHEWLAEFNVAGVEEKTPMGVLERLRSEADPTERPWRAPRLRNVVFKRKTICEHVQRVAASKHGGHVPQQIQKAIDDVRSEAKEKLGDKWMLRSLYNYIRGYKDKKIQAPKSGHDGE